MRYRLFAGALFIGLPIVGGVASVDAAPMSSATTDLVGTTPSAAVHNVYWAIDPYGRRYWVPRPYWHRYYAPPPPLVYYHPYRPYWHRRWRDRWGYWHYG